MKLQLLAAKLLDANTKKLIKAGYLSSSLELTETGSRILETIIFEGALAKMVEQADKILNSKTAKAEEDIAEDSE